MAKLICASREDLRRRNHTEATYRLAELLESLFVVEVAAADLQRRDQEQSRDEGLRTSWTTSSHIKRKALCGKTKRLTRCGSALTEDMAMEVKVSRPHRPIGHTSSVQIWTRDSGARQAAPSTPGRCRLAQSARGAVAAKGLLGNLQEPSIPANKPMDALSSAISTPRAQKTGPRRHTRISEC